MTGRDNVIFVARIYGEDPRKVLDFVEDFSELGSYLDVPIYTYSSGMGARLAFGMSMAIPFDCYLIDEITSVGDARFSKRCDEVFSQRRKAADIIMVSHSMETIRAMVHAGNRPDQRPRDHLRGRERRDRGLPAPQRLIGRRPPRDVTTCFCRLAVRDVADTHAAARSRYR